MQQLEVICASCGTNIRTCMICVACLQSKINRINIILNKKYEICML